MNILYIMGTGRSGTTILEVLLKASKDIDGFGEVTHFPRDGVLKNVECSCGSASNSCVVWGEVVKTLQGSNFQDIDKINGKLEHHRNFFSNVLKLSKTGAMKTYQALNTQIFSALKLKTDVKTLIDSSKYPGRAVALSRIYGSDFFVIGVTRCPFELLSAFQKDNEGEQLPKSYLMAAFYYLYVITCMRVSSFFIPKFVSIRYERLVQNPVRELEKIECDLNVDLSGSKRAVANKEGMSPGHIVTGNRLRKKSQIIFETRQKNHTVNMPAGARALGFLLVVYRNALRF